ncbi:hypothetical protein [Algiphilus sp.]|uniref:hypothetical protein n=1 Tax=Algiphilus sp. TaxID=1872431 RepID=UPI0032ECD364
MIPFQGSHLLVWPEDAAIDLFHTEPTIGAITFSDAERYLPALVDVLEEAAADRARIQPIAGGAFVVEDILQWEDDALEVADARAWKFVSSMLGKRVRTEQAHAIMIPRQRELPLRPHALGTASVVMLVQGSGLYLRHHELNVGPVPPPQRFGQGGMLAHPSTMRPCVAENTGDGPVWLLSWDYQPVSTA